MLQANLCGLRDLSRAWVRQHRTGRLLRRMLSQTFGSRLQVIPERMQDHQTRCARMLAAAMMRHAASQLVLPTGPVKSLGSSTQDRAFVAPKFGTDIWVKVAGDSGAHAGPPDKVCTDAGGCTDATCCTPTCSTYNCSQPGFVNTGQSGERNSDTP